MSTVKKKKRSSKMLSRFTISVAVILFVCSGAFADYDNGIGLASGSIYQYQNFVVGDLLGFDSSGLNSILVVSHGEDAFAINSLEIENEQSIPTSFKPPWCTPVFPNDDPKTAGYQWQEADIKQKTEAESGSGIITVSAFFSGFGEQEQAIGFSDDPKSQNQTLGLAADQVLLASGPAEGWATNDADDMSQAQVGLNTAGSMGEYSLIDAFQYSEVDGAPNTTVSALNSMIATTAQTQTVF